MTNTNYQKAKKDLKNVSIQLKEDHSTDKPMIRQGINDFANYFSRDYSLSEYETNLLSNYACKLHPKN